MTDYRSFTHYTIDLHVHTANYSECAELLDPNQIGRYARQVELDGIVLTEHDTMWEQDEFYELQRQTTGVQLFNGIEVSTRDGSHLVVLGIEDRGPLRKGIDIAEAIDFAHQQDGIAILAHPFRKGLPPLHYIRHLDAIETGSTSLCQTEATLAAHLASTLGKPPIACSDAHSLQRIGWAFLSLPERPRDMRHLCQMIKEGMGFPVLPNPFFQ